MKGEIIMENPYEFGMATEFYTPLQLNVTPDYSNQKQQTALVLEIQKATKKVEDILPNHQGGGWTIVSHSLTWVGQTVVLSFLLQRPRR